MSKYLWYSGATDITGIALAQALGIGSGKTKPRNANIIIGWGTKTNENLGLGDIKTLNHPNAIRKNRDKLGVLDLLKADRDLRSNIANYHTSRDIVRHMERGNVGFPLIGRKRHHQGGKGLWICLAKGHVSAAIAAGSDYFQTYIDIVSEYRLHVFCGNIIYAVKKIENPSESSWIAQRKEKVIEHATKNDVRLDNSTMEYVLKRLVKEADLPDRIVRSNKKGWKFSGVALNTIPESLKNAAIKAVSVIGLDFGAVDCAIDMGRHPFIIEVNTGPGLQGTSLDKYVIALRDKLAEMERPVARAPAAAGRGAAGRGAHRAVGADAAAEVTINDEAMVHMMNAVRSPAEARRLLDLAGRRPR